MRSFKLYDTSIIIFNDFMFLTTNNQTSLPDIIPDIIPALSSKNPQAKEGALKFLGRCLSSATTPIQVAQVKPLSEALATLVEDGYEGARTEAATCLGTLMKMVGERAMNAVLEGLDDMRKAKVREAYEKATVKCKTGASGPPKPAATSEATSKKPAAKKTATAKPAATPAEAGEESERQACCESGKTVTFPQWPSSESHLSHRRSLQPLLFQRPKQPLQPRSIRPHPAPQSLLKLARRNLLVHSIPSNTGTRRKTPKPLPLI
jgi:hypothetical protein